MRERGGNRAGWMGEWDEGEKRGKGLMDGGVGLGIEEKAGLDGWGSGVRESGKSSAGWMGEWDEGERRGTAGWMNEMGE